MHGRTALAALLVSAALSGCGQEAMVAPARIEISGAPPPPPAAAATPAPERRGIVRSGTLRTHPTVSVPAAAPAAPAAIAVPVRRPRANGGRRFRATHLRALRAYCAGRPAGDPRCVGGRVDERVALAGFEAPR